ncbi:RNA-binding domain-containing protein [Acaromyces ingoldii]|uniref:RNA-binding domain-containing protein n=1 Tax=Acaromyces ingoldii TaxID=215250 RepID=A0A316YMT9_9BASI|nr:RNA-binding domain-containing protein [Acaromyces ingoldii]PWN90356.1 RNA-binding domain-containing protein [Acaromyces ingoldii]
MASYLASIYGTEQDKVNCSFYFKIGACRHGDRCSRKHTKPPYSQTILVANVYQNPKHADPMCPISEEELQAQFNDFYEDFFVELAKYGAVVEMHVCDNVGEHLIGNVYARFEWEEEAQRAVDALNDRWYAGRPLFAELSPVTDFREACCRQHESNECQRGGFCNFMHVRPPNQRLVHQLHHEQSVEVKMRKRKEREAKAAEREHRKGGWKDDVEGTASPNGSATGPGTGGDDWRRGKSGGDWRNGPSSGSDWRGAEGGEDQSSRRRSQSPPGRRD